jgi:hypothetical protein
MKLYLLLICLCFIIIINTSSCDSNDLYTVEDIYTPPECNNIAKVCYNILNIILIIKLVLLLENLKIPGKHHIYVVGI